MKIKKNMGRGVPQVSLLRPGIPPQRKFWDFLESVGNQSRQEAKRKSDQVPPAPYLGSSVNSCARCRSTAASEKGNTNVEPPYHAVH